MNILNIINPQDFLPDEADREYMQREADKLKKKIEEAIKKEKIAAEVFIGGSFARGTMVKSDDYDIDLFVRFDWKYEEISKKLEDILKTAGVKFEKIHGSRDYFMIKDEIKKGITFEVIPVIKISNPKEARNVTDLSYFHVKYIKNKLKSKGLAEQVILAKVFCKSQRVYGAESYIKGLSGYAIECLICHYRSFEKMAKEIAKAKDRIIIDSEKKFKKIKDIPFELNESKLQSPIVIIDPTWKERNVSASLSQETFNKLQKALKSFLAKQKKDFFVLSAKAGKLFSEKEGKDREKIVIRLYTEKQEGDIAGTKMKKFADYLAEEMKKHFALIAKDFIYGGADSAEAFYLLKKKEKVIKSGPPIKMKEHAAAFRKNNKNTYVKAGRIYADIRTALTASDFLTSLLKRQKEKVKEMAITGIEIKTTKENKK